MCCAPSRRSSSPPDASLLVSQALRRFRAAPARTERISAGGCLRLVVGADGGVAAVGRAGCGGGAAAAGLGRRAPGEEPAPGHGRTLRADAQSALSGDAAGGGRTGGGLSPGGAGSAVRGGLRAGLSAGDRAGGAASAQAVS